jgi:hypothetical protein
VSFHFNPIIEIGLQTIFQRERLLPIGWLWWNGNFQKPFIDELVVIALVLFPGVKDVHFQSQEWQLKLLSDEGKRF